MEMRETFPWMNIPSMKQLTKNSHSKHPLHKLGRRMERVTQTWKSKLKFSGNSLDNFRARTFDSE